MSRDPCGSTGLLIVSNKSRYLNLLCGIEKIVVCNYHDNKLAFKKDYYESLLDFDFYILNFFLKEFSYVLLLDKKNKIKFQN